MRAQLRAAARASSERNSSEEEELALAAAGSGASANRRGGARKGAAGRRQDDKSDPNTCAAAIETLLWFGLALGEQKDKEKRAEEEEDEEDLTGSLAAWAADMDEEEAREAALPRPKSLGDLSSWDWEEAMREAGIGDEPVGSLLEGMDGEQQTGEQPAERGLKNPTPPTPAAPRQKAEASSRPKPLCVGERQVGPPSLQQFESETGSSTTTSEHAPSEGDLEETRSRACEDPGTMSGEGEGEECDGTDSGRTTPRLDYSSPDSPEGLDRQATRRSMRQPKPQRPWLSSVQQPLLKWEKEQQDKSQRPKRRTSREGIVYDTDSGEDLVGLLSPADLLETTTDSVLDLVFGSAQDQSKRQRVAA